MEQWHHVKDPWRLRGQRHHTNRIDMGYESYTTHRFRFAFFWPARRLHWLQYGQG